MKLVKVRTEEEVKAERRIPLPRPELLQESFEILDQIPLGGEGTLELEPEDNQRAIKRRLTLASKERQLRVRWASAPDRHLRFRVVPRQETPPPKKRTRKPKKQPQAQEAQI